MANQHNLRIRLSLLTLVLDFIHSQDWRDHERFASFLVDRIISKSPDDETSLEAILQSLQHPFFAFNSITKREFIVPFPSQRIIKLMRSHPVLSEGFVEETFRKIGYSNKSIRRLYLDDIESFSKIRNVKKSDVASRVPIVVPERSVKELLCKILGVYPIPGDWGGERSDLFADVVYRGKRIPAAFMLKGKGTPGTLTVARCGKNGDQVVRLMDEPARLFVVQHVDAIDSNVVRLLEMAVASTAKGSQQYYYCVVDGVETARLFEAYR